VGLANEKSIQHQSVLYTTASKLISLFFKAPDLAQTKAYPWNWRTCSYMVVDDINPGNPIKEDIISADHFLRLIDNYSKANDVNRNAIKNCSIIWVLGNDDADKNIHDNWQKMLITIGVPKENIRVVELTA